MKDDPVWAEGGLGDEECSVLCLFCWDSWGFVVIPPLWSCWKMSSGQAEISQSSLGCGIV